MNLSKISNLSETMLIPLYARALEGRRKHPHFRDFYAEEIIHQINPFFQIYKKNKMNMWGCAARTIILDRETNNYLNTYPHATIINLGAGLDARFYRVDNGLLQWVNIDLPEVIAIRKDIFPSHERIKNISASILDEEWVTSLATNAPVLFIAEGLLMYFSEAEVQALFQKINTYFPHATLFLEFMSEKFLKHQKLHPAVKINHITFKWGLRSANDFVHLVPAFKCTGEFNFTDVMKKYSPIFISLIAPVLRSKNNFIGCFQNN